VFNSWDRFLLPFPGSKGVVVYGRPIAVKPDVGEETIQKAMTELEVELNRITRQADHYFGHNFDG
jgi:hypothetical protein